MLPRLYMLGRQTQNLPIRSACARPSHPVVHHALQRRRFGGTSEKDAAERATGPNQGVLPHVSEEAAALGEITGEGGTELMQGTYIQDVRNLLGGPVGFARFWTAAKKCMGSNDSADSQAG